MSCTSLAAPPLAFLMARATGAVRRPAAITRSGQGGANCLRLALVRPPSVAPRRTFGSPARALYSRCLTSNPSPKASATPRHWLLWPARSSTKAQTTDIQSSPAAVPRMAVSVVRVLIRSGSTLSSMSAALPDVTARSKAGSKSSVLSTDSPWAP